MLFPAQRSETDEREIRTFMSVMESRCKKASVIDQLEKIPSYYSSNAWIERFHKELDTNEDSYVTGRVDIIRAVVNSGVAVILRPLDEGCRKVANVHNCFLQIELLYNGSISLSSHVGCTVQLYTYSPKRQLALHCLLSPESSK